jgi:serine protease inhibitor
MQEVFITVDEKGTSAAAVTIIPAPEDSIIEPTTPFEMICNRPFVFVLCAGTQSGVRQVLFTGIVNHTQGNDRRIHSAGS